VPNLSVEQTIEPGFDSLRCRKECVSILLRQKDLGLSKPVCVSPLPEDNYFYFFMVKKPPSKNPGKAGRQMRA